MRSPQSTPQPLKRLRGAYSEPLLALHAHLENRGPNGEPVTENSRTPLWPANQRGFPQTLVAIPRRDHLSSAQLQPHSETRLAPGSVAARRTLKSAEAQLRVPAAVAHEPCPSLQGSSLTPRYEKPSPVLGHQAYCGLRGRSACRLYRQSDVRYCPCGVQIPHPVYAVPAVRAHLPPGEDFAHAERYEADDPPGQWRVDWHR